MGTTNYDLIGDARLTAALSTQVLNALVDANRMPSHPAIINFENPVGSRVLKITQLEMGGYTPFRQVAEGVAVVPGDIGATSYTITPSRWAKAVEITDHVRMTGPGGVLDFNVESLAQDIVAASDVAKMDLLCSLLGGFASGVSDFGVDAEYVDFLDLISTLEVNSQNLGSNGAGRLIAIFHPQQWADIRKNLEITLGTSNLLAWDGIASPLQSLGGAYKGAFHNVDVYTSSRVPTANSGADRAGGMWCRGAIGMAGLNPVVEFPGQQVILGGGILLERDREVLTGTSVTVGTHYAGASRLIDLCGAKLVTDA